ncbi:class I SAM-dependent methyltransferase [Legionella micdadei]|uniref:Generic methyl-transferase n=1 Tax=Legionella micdadei TaxID=451 RepID=A0A098GH68_LEGMI|nr:methyltransferase domain-containing protein [Legionella micdadei]KTD27688.1 methyl-transferase [Legionella micdadei]NSL17673.1 methyltransferase domain-containing protein [Legionella micdadei]CEG60826.1 Generic methyl-transferase [Legionella micdadei]SCY14409.1 Methyltransferase domain-containing protein [Legionella micdadei]
MSFDGQKARFRALEQWFSSAQGLDISDFFESELAHLGEILHGETLLQLGNYGKNPWLQKLHYCHKWNTSPLIDPSSTFRSSFTQLPLDRNSIDCVIAPLVMEAFSHQKNPIDEIDRVLKPMGYAIFFGINPLSLWGLFVRLKRYSIFGHLAGKPTSVLSVKRAMLHRGYVLCNISSFYYIPPVSTKEWLRKLEIFNELGKMISPCPAGFYCLVVQKYQAAHTDLLHSEVEEQLWERKRGLLPACQFKPKVHKTEFEETY